MCVCVCVRACVCLSLCLCLCVPVCSGNSLHNPGGTGSGDVVYNIDDAGTEPVVPAR